MSSDTQQAVGAYCYMDFIAYTKKYLPGNKTTVVKFLNMQQLLQPAASALSVWASIATNNVVAAMI